MLELIGLLAGVVMGILVPWTIPSQYSLYVAAGLLAALDSALGGYCARISHCCLSYLARPEIGNPAVPCGSGGFRHPHVPKLC